MYTICTKWVAYCIYHISLWFFTFSNWSLTLLLFNDFNEPCLGAVLQGSLVDQWSMYSCLIHGDLAPPALLAFRWAAPLVQWSLQSDSLPHPSPTSSQILLSWPAFNPAETLSVSKHRVHHQAQSIIYWTHYIFQLLTLSCTKMKNFQEWSATCTHSNGLEFYLHSVMWTKDFGDLFLSQTNIGQALMCSQY